MFLAAPPESRQTGSWPEWQSRRGLVPPNAAASSFEISYEYRYSDDQFWRLRLGKPLATREDLFPRTPFRGESICLERNTRPQELSTTAEIVAQNLDIRFRLSDSLFQARPIRHSASGMRSS